MFNKILVPLDESDLSEQSLPFAKEVAKQFNSEVVLLQAIPPVTLTTANDMSGGMEDATVTSMTIESARSLEASNLKAANSYLDAKLKEFRSDNIRVSSRAVIDMPAKAILDVCRTENVDLIVITTHGRSGLGRAIVGSVADQVIRHAGIPVMVIRPKSH